jgi:DNA-directed RNA polymerase subunit RPC12/RpoP
VGGRISLDCIECRAPIPVGAIVPGARCHTCGFDVPLDWIDWFILFGMHVAEVDAGGLLGAKVINLGDLHSHVEYSGTPPRCSRCDHVFDGLDELASAASTGGFSCPSCTQRVPVRLGDAFTAEGVHPGVACVVGEASRPPLPKVSITCVNCGAPLSADGSERSVPCDYCRETSYLSDALWLHLHPEHAPRWLWVICDRAS